MDVRDVALGVVFAPICAMPALLIIRRTRFRIAVFLARTAAAIVLPVLAIPAGISGYTLVAAALLCPVLVVLAALPRRSSRARLSAATGIAAFAAGIANVALAWPMRHAENPNKGTIEVETALGSKVRPKVR